MSHRESSVHWAAAWSLSVLVAGLVPVPCAGQQGSPAGAVPVARLQARRAALLDSLGSAVAVLRSADLRDLEGDYPQDSDFRQANDFFYLTGLETAGSWLVLVAHPDAPDESILYLPPRDSAAEIWTGPTLGPGPEAAALTGILQVRPATELQSDLAALIPPSGRVVAELGPTAPDTAAVQALFSPNAVQTVGDLRLTIGQLRLIKDSDEMVRLRRAIAITTQALREAMQTESPGQYEYEIEATIEASFRRGGAERVGFPTIVGSGPNSTTLHYDKNRRQARRGDLVVADVGAEFGYYTADVTRTFPAGGKFTPRQRAIYELVLATQQTAIDSVRPGLTVQALNRIARAYMRTHSGTLCGEATCDHFFPHGLSHWLGMDVHDVGDYATPLAPGMVLTVEPGIYLPAESLGVRIEDDVLVTATGHELLSGTAPRRPDDIEKLMAEGAKRRAACVATRKP